MKLSSQMQTLLRYLANAEGTKIHKLDGEKDITSMYGIYRYQNPQAEIFKKIDSLALELGIKTASTEWGDMELEYINNHISRSKDLVDEFIYLAGSFYENYYQKIRLDLFHEDCVVAIASMYANSRRLSIKALQYAINTMNKNGFIEYKTLLEDGKLGSNTLKGLEACLYACKTVRNVGLLFESYMLLGMSAEYSILIKEKPDKYNRFSTGWDNRLKKLQQSR